MSASRVGELGGSVDSQAKLGLSSNAQDATQRVHGKSEAGFTPYNLDNAGKGDIQEYITTTWAALILMKKGMCSILSKRMALY